MIAWKMREAPKTGSLGQRRSVDLLHNLLECLRCSCSGRFACGGERRIYCRCLSKLAFNFVRGFLHPSSPSSKCILHTSHEQLRMSIRSCGSPRSCLETKLPNVPFLAPRALGLWPKTAAVCISPPLPLRMRHARRLGLGSGSRVGTGWSLDFSSSRNIQHARGLRYSSSTTFQEAGEDRIVREPTEDGEGARSTVRTGPPSDGHMDLQSPVDVPRASNTVKAGSSSGESAFRRWKRSSLAMPSRGSRSGFRTPSASNYLGTLDTELTVDEIKSAYEQVQSLPSLETVTETLRTENTACHRHTVSRNETLRVQVRGEESVVKRLYSDPRKPKAASSPQANTTMALDVTGTLGLRGHRTPELVKSLVPGFIRAGFTLGPGAIQKHRRQRRADAMKLRNHEPRNPLGESSFTNRVWKMVYPKVYFAKWSNKHHEVHSLLDKDVTIWMNELFQDGLEVSSVSLNWKNLPVEDRSLRQQQILLWSLANSPQTVPLLLEATTTPGYTKRASYERVCDCFFYLDKFFPGENILDRQHSATGASFVYSYLDPNRLNLKYRRPLNVLLKYCTDVEACAVFDVLTRRRTQKMAFNTALFLMGRFTKMGKFEYAVRTLEYVRDQGYDLASPRVLSRCTALLRKSSEICDDPSLSSSVLTRVLRAGVEPNDILRNVILKNVFKSEGGDVGWKVFNHLLTQGFTPDGITYLTLIGDAINRSDNLLLDVLLAQISGNDELAKDEILLGYSLHAIRRLNMDNNVLGKDDLIPRLFPIFARLHDIGPLKDLRIIPEDWAPPEGAISATSPPPPNLGNMIAAHLHAQTSPDNVLALYDRFRDLVIAQHPSIFRLTETDHTYNAFLMALYRHAAYLPHSIRIVEDMLASHCTPTIITWSILLLSFMFHDQPSSAEKVRAMMLKRGVRFNQIAWDIWVRGHAGMNMGDKVSNALAEMEREGFTFGVEDWGKQKGSKGMQLLGRILEDWQRSKEERARILQWEEIVGRDEPANSIDKEEKDKEACQDAHGLQSNSPEETNIRTHASSGPEAGTDLRKTLGKRDEIVKSALLHWGTTQGMSQHIGPGMPIEFGRSSNNALSSWRLLRVDDGQHDEVGAKSTSQVRREVQGSSHRISPAQDSVIDTMVWKPVSEGDPEALEAKTSKERSS
jgi:hypothetical protein